MGDVRHEVTAGGLHADIFAFIGAVDDDKAAVIKSQWLNHRPDLRDAVSRAPLGNSYVNGAGLLVFEDLLRGLPYLRVNGPVMDQGHLVRGRIRHDDFLAAVQHRQRRRRALHGQVQHLADRRDLVGLGIGGLAVARNAPAQPRNRWQRQPAGHHAGGKGKNQFHVSSLSITKSPGNTPRGL